MYTRHKFGHLVQTEELRKEEGKLIFPRPPFRGVGQEAVPGWIRSL